MKKINEVQDKNSCFNKAKDDEPIFVLRAQDKFAPFIVRMWAELVNSNTWVVIPKVKEAKALARKMEKWAEENHSKFPD